MRHTFSYRGPLTSSNTEAATRASSLSTVRSSYLHLLLLCFFQRQACRDLDEENAALPGKIRELRRQEIRNYCHLTCVLLGSRKPRRRRLSSVKSALLWYSV